MQAEGQRFESVILHAEKQDETGFIGRMKKRGARESLYKKANRKGKRKRV